MNLNRNRDSCFPRGWKLLIIVTLAIGIFCRFANLENKVYTADEVRSFYRLSGYVREDVIQRSFNGEIITVEDLQWYQSPNPERNLHDAIDALAGNPEHPPLYYLMVRLWMQWFGDFLQTPARLLSILIGLLIFPSIYWLCKELFESPGVGWFAIALIAVSPHHILMSQYAREYSLWAVMTVLSSAALLKALRGDKRSFILYAVTLGVGFYSHLFFALVALTHGIYVLGITGFKPNKNLGKYLLASLAGLLAFAPWIFVVISRLSDVQEKTVWVRKYETNIGKTVRGINSSMTDVFIDFNNSTRIERYLDLLVLIVVLFSLYFLCTHAPKNVWLFIVLMIGITAAGQVVPDLILDGRRSLQARYFIPCFLAIQLSVSYLFDTFAIPTNLKNGQQNLWRCIFLMVLSLGVISGFLISQASAWDYLYQTGTASHRNLKIAPLINKTERPLVISEATHSFLLALSYIVDEKTKFLLVRDKDVAQWKERVVLSDLNEEFSDLFIYFPDREFSAFFEQNEAFPIKSLVPGIQKVVKTE